jgi:hypothetical protein
MDNSGFRIPEFDPGEDNILSSYCEELKLVKTLQELNIFVARWKELWFARFDTTSSFETAMSDSVLDGQYSQEVLNCIVRSFDITDDGFVNSPGFNMAMAIRMPWVLSEAMSVAKKYIVPLNCAVFQLLRAYKMGGKSA